MTTGVKIAIGCGVALILGIIVVAVGIGGAAYWAKGKVEGLTGNERRIEELHKKANATPFERPDDGIIREDRLLKFLDIRQRVFGVYEKHRAALDAMGKKEKGDFSDLTTGLSLINEIRVAQAQALADVGMSEDEYRFMVEQVYKTAWASEVARQARENSSDINVPPANIALFQKYEAQIKQYAMGGLEWIGL